MNDRSPAGALGAVQRLRRARGNAIPASRQQLNALRRRVAELEKEVQESRRLNRRLAELTDIVQELLVPVAQRDEDLLRERLETYASKL